MLRDRVEGKWIDTFSDMLDRCGVERGEVVAILSETQSRALNVHLSELACQRLGAVPYHLVVTTPQQSAPVPVRSTGASQALQQLSPVLAALCSSTMVVDCTLEGLLHAPELPEVLRAGARVLMVSNEHPEALERLVPDDALEGRVKAAARRLKACSSMRVTSAAGTALDVDLSDTPAMGVWGYTRRAGSIAHWPGGLVVTFPRAGAVDGQLVLDAGDINLSFKRFVEAPVTMIIENDHVVSIEGEGTDAELMRRYFAAWGDREAYATSHVGFGLNHGARYESLAMYDQRDTNGTELRAFAGNFLYSTGANEFAGRHTQGHFDLPLRGCTITLDGEVVVEQGQLQGELA